MLRFCGFIWREGGASFFKISHSPTNKYGEVLRFGDFIFHLVGVFQFYFIENMFKCGICRQVE